MVLQIIFLTTTVVKVTYITMITDAMLMLSTGLIIHVTWSERQPNHVRKIFHVLLKQWI